MKIALYKYVSYPSTSLFAREWINGEAEPQPPEMARVSEWVEVEFPLLPPGDVIAAQVNALDAQIKQVTEQWHRAVAAINDRKRELLSLTHTPDVL